MDKLVSIVIANYNKEKYIRESLNATLNQDYKNIEVIIIDDGSTDNSPAIIKEMAANERRLKYKICNHKGKVKAYNYGISLARGDYLKIWSSDDVLFKNAISALVREINGFDLVCHNSDITDERLNIIEKNFFSRNLRKNKKATINDVINGSSFPSGFYLFSRDVSDKIFPLPEKAIYEDWYIFMSVIYKGFKIKYCDKSLSYYRQYNKSTFGGVLNQDKNIFLYRLERNLSMIDVFNEILPEEYQGALISKKKELELTRNGDMFSILAHKCPIRLKSRIMMQRYLYFTWLLYRRCYHLMKK